MKQQVVIPLLLAILLQSLLLLGQGQSYQCQEDQNILIRADFTTFTQSKSGFLWLGSSDEIWAYDGTNLHPKLRAQDSLLRASTALFTDSKDQVWAGFANGAIACTNQLGFIQPWLLEEGWPQARITAFAEDAAGRIWIGTYGEGVYCYTRERLYQFGREDGMESSDIYTLVADQAGNIWAGTDAGVHLLDWTKQEKQISVFDSDDGLPDNIITSIQPRENGELWLGTYEGGLIKGSYENEELEFERIQDWPGGIISSISEVDQRTLWVGTKNQGIRLYDIQSGIWLPEQDTRKLPQRIIKLYFDQEGLLWILSRDHGLCRIQTRLAVWDKLPLSPQALAVDRQNQLWIGSANGLDRYTPRSAQLETIKLSRRLNIISLYCDAQDRIWVGTFGEGLFVYYPKQQRLQQIREEAGLTNGSILAITGRDSTIWLATLGGVFTTKLEQERDAGKITFQQPLGSALLGTDFLYCVYPDGRGRVWFGTDGHGISCLHPDGQVSAYQESADGTPIRSVYGITEDTLGRIWISTDEQHIFMIDDAGLHRPPFELALSPNEIANLATDGQGNITIAHRRGLAVFDVQTEELIDYHHLSETFTFQPVLNASCRSPKGQLWLAGTGELLRYEAFQNTYRQQPTMSINHVSVNLEPFDLQAQDILKAKENNLVFHYAGVWLGDPEEVQFQYRLRGFDPTWITTKDRQAVYSNLPPGEYQFELRGTQNNSFQPDHSIASSSFRIKWPIYLQPWFIVSTALILFLISRHFLRQRELRLQKEALLLKDKVESQYETLKSQINPHFLFNSFNTLVTLIEEKPSKAVTYVEKLSDFYRSILQYREQDTVSIQEEIRIVKDYHFLLRQRYDDNLKLNISPLPKEAYLPPLVLQMLVENAVKHNIISSSRPLSIDIYQEDQFIVVKNSIQAKLTKIPSTGFGLQNIKNRYALVSPKKVKLERENGVFKVAIPYLSSTENFPLEQN